MDSSNNRQRDRTHGAEDGAALVDAAHFASLLDRCAKRVHAYVLNRVRNRAAADDLTQEALSNAWESRGGFDPKKDELAWLIAIASNAIADHVKSCKAQKRAPTSGQKAPRGDGLFAIGPTLDAATRMPVDPAKSMIDAEEIMATQAAIDRLDDSKRQAIEFRRAGLSYDEIAIRMGVKPGTVGSLISRAITELQEMLGFRADRL